MNKFMLYAFLAFAAVPINASLTKIREESIFATSSLTAIKLLHDRDKFIVSDENGFHEVEGCWLDSDLRRLSKNEIALQKFLDVATIEVKKDREGVYLLKSHVRGPGGGPWTALGASVALGKIGLAIGTFGAPILGPAAPVIGTTVWGVGTVIALALPTI